MVFSIFLADSSGLFGGKIDPVRNNTAPIEIREIIKIKKSFRITEVSYKKDPRNPEVFLCSFKT